VLFSDSDGSVHAVYTNSSDQMENIYSSVKNPGAITVDWLHNMAYIASNYEIYQCSLPPNCACRLALEHLETRASDIKVDPVNGFLYYTQSGTSSGIFRVDLNNIGTLPNAITTSCYDTIPTTIPTTTDTSINTNTDTTDTTNDTTEDTTTTATTTPIPTPPPATAMRHAIKIVDNKQDAFTIDLENIQIYFPDSRHNTIMSTFLDGEVLTDIRPNVVKANFDNIKSIVYFNGSFVWTDGEKVLKEVYDRHGAKYHYNKIHFKESPFSGFNMFHSSAQPMPVPTNPPSNLEVLFSDTSAFIRWDKPEKIIYQGNGSWSGWKYEMTVQEEGSLEMTTSGLEQFSLTIHDLKPSTKYIIKMRAYIGNRYGPWTDRFIGRTLFKDPVMATITFETRYSIFRVGLDGRRALSVRLNKKKTRNYKHNIPIGRITGTSLEFLELLLQKSVVRCATVDSYSNKIYWSNANCGICRVNPDLTHVEKIMPEIIAENLAIDSPKGILYWNTRYEVKASFLNGLNVTSYYVRPYQPEGIRYMTLDIDSHKLYWSQLIDSGTRLYIADMIGYSNTIPSGPSKIIDLDNRMYGLQYFSDRFIWLNSQRQLVVSDMRGNNVSRVLPYRAYIMSYSVFHPSIYQYPAGLNKSTIQVVPQNIPHDSIGVVGTWYNFNITWREAMEVNYGRVHYDLSLGIKEFKNFTKSVGTSNPWHTVRGLPPYTEILVLVQASTYYGSTITTEKLIRSPMSVPNEPLNPRVYINERKELQSSEEFLSADLRWSPPDNRFGVLHKYKVLYKIDKSQLIETEIEPNTRQFVVERLIANRTYTFTIQACTIIACSKETAKVSITSNNTKPLPELLIASEEGIKLAEMDNDLKVSEKISFKGSTSAFTFLAKDNSFFWISSDSSTLKMRNNKMEIITLKKLTKAINDITVDWIDHTVYIAAGAEIHCYNIYTKAPCLLRHSDGVIYSIKVSPFTSTLFWTETQDRKRKNSKVYKSRANGSDVVEILPGDYGRSGGGGGSKMRHKRRSPKCQCPTNMDIDSTIGVDYTNDNIYFVDHHRKVLWRTDSEGCHCEKVFSQKDNEFESLNSLTTDHVRVYWSNRNRKDDTTNIYSVLKNNGKDLRVNHMSGVNKIVAFGSHLQPLPDVKCLRSEPVVNYTITNEFITNTSVTLNLPDIQRQPDCESVSQPTTNFTVHYTEVPSKDTDISCLDKNVHCQTVESFNKVTTIGRLKPYTNYLFQVAISNIYTDYLADVLSEPITIETKTGLPSPIRSLEAYTMTYEDILLMWRPPLHPRANISTLVYVVTYVTTLEMGKIVRDTVQVSHEKQNNSTLLYVLNKLKPAHDYRIQVKACDMDMVLCSSSIETTNKTAQELAPIKFLDVNSTAVNVSWTTPADTPIHANVFAIWSAVKPRWIVLPQYGRPTLNQTTSVSFTGLRPNTVYTFAVRVAYIKFGIRLNRHWPNFNSTPVYSVRTLIELPKPPVGPYVHKLNSGNEEVTWKNLEEQFPPTLHELQYKPATHGNWTTIYNDSAPHWLIEDEFLNGENYIFRVRSRNGRGWSDFSKSSRPFFHKIDHTNGGVYQYIVIPVCLFIVIVILIAIYILFKKQQSKKKRMSHVTDGHNPDVELATLQDLPHIAVQQNNTLYSVGMVPTDDDLIALPHFRHDQLIRKKFLGSGAFGEVFEGVCKSCVTNGETRVAVKTLRKCASEHEKEEFLKEALLMSNFKHEHILRLLGVCFDGNPQFIVLELMEGGDLLLYLRNYRPSSSNQMSLTLLDLMKVCVHVSRGCKYLEEMHFVHRDLAARNCLVSSKNPKDMVVKIGDFGLARDIYKNDYYRKEGEGLLPVRWMSPESLVDGVFTTQSDIWSFGVLMWEVITYGQQPYPARTNLEVLQYVRSGGRLDRPDNCPEYLYQLKLNCWNYAPEDRPTSCYILEQLELFYQRLIEESMINKNTTNGSSVGSDNDEKLGIPPISENYIMTETTMRHSQNRIPKSSIGSEFTPEDDPTPLLEDDNTSTNTSDYLEPSKLEAPKYLELISDSKQNSTPTPGKQVVHGARPKTSSTSSFCNSPPLLPDKCQQNGSSSGKPNNNNNNNNNNNENLTSNGSVKSSLKGGSGARRNFQGLHYAQLATCSTDSSVDESDDDDENCTDMNYITPQVSMSCTLLNQVQTEPAHQRHLSKQTSAPAPLRNNSLSNEGLWVNGGGVSGPMANPNSDNFLFHNSCASPTKLQVWADKNRNLVGKNSGVLALSDCPEYINTPPQPNYPSGQQTGTGTPVFSSQPTLV
ncbi:proto-oncogene tyrosine-protein kinase ROS-like isoform X2, partial, partial [Argonauta hians]